MAWPPVIPSPPAIDAFIVYYRRYLEDPSTIELGPTPQAVDLIVPPDPNITYYRRYLNDPQS